MDTQIKKLAVDLDTAGEIRPVATNARKLHRGKDSAEPQVRQAAIDFTF